MECVVQIREVYGRPTAYPVNDTAKLLCELAGTKTLTPQALATIRKLGYTVSLASSYANLQFAMEAR